MDYRIELVLLPVGDADRSRTFYGDTLGWDVDHDGNTWTLQELPRPASSQE